MSSNNSLRTTRNNLLPPDQVASSDGTNNVNGATGENTGENVDSLTALSALRMLHCKRHLHSISNAVKYLDGIVLLNKEQRLAVSKELVDLQGLSTLLFSLEKFPESKSATSAIIAVLCEITSLDDRSGNILVALDGVNVILTSAKKYPEDATISGDAVSIMLNLNINIDSFEAVVGDDVVEFCMEVTQRFPENMAVQVVGARYFTEMTKLEDQQDSLINRGVDKVLLDAFHKFRGKHDYKYERDICQESLARLFSNKKAKKSRSRT
jgi:hypothetical protein